MNKKLVAGAIIAIAAGLTTFLYSKKRRNKLQAVAANGYDAVDNAFHDTVDRVESLYK